jgi:hypothetical protein
MPCLGHPRRGPAEEELVGASPGRISIAFDEGDSMAAAGQEQRGGEPAQAASYHDDTIHVAQPVGAGAGRMPSCSSICSRSKIRLKEMCLPSRKRSTWR